MIEESLKKVPAFDYTSRKKNKNDNEDSIQSAKGKGDLQYILKVAEKNFSAKDKEITEEELKKIDEDYGIDENTFRFFGNTMKENGEFSADVKSQIEKCVSGDTH